MTEEGTGMLCVAGTSKTKAELQEARLTWERTLNDEFRTLAHLSKLHRTIIPALSKQIQVVTNLRLPDLHRWVLGQQGQHSMTPSEINTPFFSSFLLPSPAPSFLPLRCTLCPHLTFILTHSFMKTPRLTLDFLF